MYERAAHVGRLFFCASRSPGLDLFQGKRAQNCFHGRVLTNSRKLRKLSIFVHTLFAVRNLRNLSAYLLLLLFLRVMVPEKVLVALHAHAHAEDKPHDENRPHIDKKHTHCPTAELFDTPFHSTETLVSFSAPLPLVDGYLGGYAFIWKFSYPQTASPRGPPAVA